MVPQKDPLGILGEQPKEKKQADPLGILKKKEPLEAPSVDGGGAGISAPQLVSEKAPKGFEGLKPAKVQPVEIKEPSVGEDTVLTRKLAKAQKPAVATTEVRLPEAPIAVAEEVSAERALAPKIAPEEGVGELEGLSNAIDRGVLQGKLADMMALGQMPKREDLKEIARINREINTIPSTGAYERFNSAPNLSTAVKEFTQNPIEITSQLIGESLAAQIRHGYSRALTGAAVGAGAGSVVPGIGTIAGAGTGYIAGMGVAGYNLEMASSIMESFREAGVDVTDEKSLTNAFDDPATLRKAREFANKRAIPIALFDMFSAGMGGKLLNKPAKTMLGKVGRIGGEVGVQAGLAGAGETTAQVVSGQKINPTAILSEMIGEAGGGAPDIVVGRMIEKKKAGQPIKKEAVQFDAKPEDLQEMLDISEASGEITDAQADEIKKEFEKVEEVRRAVPEQFRKNADIIEAVEQKRELENQKKGLDPVFARRIDEQIKALDTKIEDAAKVGEVAPQAPQTEETLNRYLSTYRRQLAERRKELTEQGIEDIEADEQVKNIKTKISNTQERISKLGEAPPVAEEVRVTTPEAAPQVPATAISQEIADLRAKEQAEYAAMDNPNDEVKRKEIYDKYDKLITPLLEKEKEVPAAPVEEELPFGEVAPREAVETKEERNLTKRALNIEASTPIGEVLQYFISGGKISPEALTEFFGKERRLGMGKIGVEERRSRTSLTNKNAPSIVALAEKIAGTDRLDQVREYREAIEEALLNHSGTKTMAEELVRDFDVDYNAMLREQEIAEIGEDVSNQVKNFIAGLPAAQKQEIADVLDTYRLEDGTIDWSKIEQEINTIDPFSEPVIQKLSEQSQKILQDGTQQFKEAGRVGRFRGEVVLSPEARRAGDAARKLAERIRAGKISKEGLRTSTGFDVVFDAALEVIATSLEAGASIADAIESGLNYIRDTEYYKNLTDKKGFEDKFSNKLNEEYAIQEQAAGEVPVQPEARASEKVEGRVSEARPKKPTEEGEAEGETAAEKKSAELSLKGINEIANEFSLDPVEGRPRKSDIDLREEAKAQIDKWVAEGSYDSKIEDLVEKAEDYQVLNDKDRVILEQHLAGVRERFSSAIESGDIKAGSKEYNARLKELKRLIDAGAKTRSAAGAALRIPSGGSVAHPLENYDTALVAKMEANNVDELTPEQIKEVEDSVKEYKQKVEEANSRIKDLEDKLSELMAQSEVGIAKKKRVVKSKEERVGERKRAIADAREALRKLRTGEAGLSAVPLPYVREFVAISPYVKKIMQSYVEEGIDNLSVIVDKLYEDFKDVVPGITRKDLRDIVGNQYSERKQTKSELKSAIKDLAEEAKLLSLYEKILAGEEPASPRKKVERNQKIKELRDKINQIRKRNREADVDYTDLKRIEDTKKRAVAKTEEYKRKIEEGDFAPSEKPVSIFNDTNLQRKYPKEYSDMLDAVQEKEDAKHEFDIALLKDEEKNMTAAQKAFKAGKLVVGTIKAIKSGIDASGALIQNFAPLTSYTSSWFKAFFNSWGDFASEKKFNRWLTQLKNNKAVWDLIEKSGLQITQLSALKEAQREEVFSNNVLDKSFKIGDKTYNIGKYTTKPFERLFTSMGNALRVDVFLKISEKWYEEGKTFESNPEDYKSLANMLNTMTGRGKLAPTIQKASDLIGGAIWSPQLMASRLNILGISDVVLPPLRGKGYYAGLSPEVRKMQIKNTAKMIGAGLALMSLASISGADEVDFDPESPTFGTIRIGNKRIPVFSNFTKYVKAIIQFITGKQNIEGERIEKKRGQTVYKFFRSGLPPSTGLIVDAVTGVDYSGQPVTAEGMVRGTIVPISIESIGKELKRDGAFGAATGIGQFFGLNITDERDYVKREDKPFEVKDPVTFKKRETTPRELETFKKRRDQIYKELTRDYEKGGETIYITQNGDIKLSIPSSVSDDELSLWKEVSYRQLDKEKAKELYKLLMSKAKKDAKSELELEEVGEKDNE